jgi:hypothetical protein
MAQVTWFNGALVLPSELALDATDSQVLAALETARSNNSFASPLPDPLSKFRILLRPGEGEDGSNPDSFIVGFQNDRDIVPATAHECIKWRGKTAIEYRNRARPRHAGRHSGNRYPGSWVWKLAWLESICLDDILRFPSWISKFAHLTKVVVHSADCSTIPDLSNTVLKSFAVHDGAKLTAVPRLPQTVRHLRLVGCCDLKSADVRPYSKLEGLDLRDNPILTQLQLDATNQSCLKHIDIRRSAIVRIPPQLLLMDVKAVHASTPRINHLCRARAVYCGLHASDFPEVCVCDGSVECKGCQFPEHGHVVSGTLRRAMMAIESTRVI